MEKQNSTSYQGAAPAQKGQPGGFPPVMKRCRGPSASRELHYNANGAPGEFVMTLEGLFKSRIQGNVQGGSLRPKSTTRLSILSNFLRLKATPGAELDI